MVGGAEGRVVVYCPGQSVGERLQRIVQQPHEGGVCGPGSFRFVTGGQGFGSGIPAVLESGEVAQRDRVQNAGRIRRRTWAGLRYAPSAPSSITKPTDSHKHWYIKRGQAMSTGLLMRIGIRSFLCSTTGSRHVFSIGRRTLSSRSILP